MGIKNSAKEDKGFVSQWHENLSKNWVAVEGSIL